MGDSDEEIGFKKPILVGKIGHLPKKLKKISKNDQVTNDPESLLIRTSEAPETCLEDINEKQNTDTEDEIKDSLKKDRTEDTSSLLSYQEPEWSGIPKTQNKHYSFEVLKEGSIVDKIDLMSKPFWSIGRLTNCDIPMQHPSISRYHAILQYRKKETEDKCGFYIYDLGSTHGTFLNKHKLKTKLYVRVQVGHLLRFGSSSRTYILNGPDEDTESESQETVTELKEMRQAELLRRQLEHEKMIEEQSRAEKVTKEQGVDWGMGEDADEATDLADNPYAQTNNEELYVDDPKKTLRGFFEREGLDLEYDCSEQGIGQFLCRVTLPLDDEKGRPLQVEVLHKGKKKEAVVQCALEACRLLDRTGLLRQATHESKKRKPKNWEENDYYESDDDTFLDRTGSIEKKREIRMKAKQPQQAETYESLLEKEKSIKESIEKLEKTIRAAQSGKGSSKQDSKEEDSLDSFMNELKKSKPDKQEISRLKSELVKLKLEYGAVIKLVNIAKPASLPPLKSGLNNKDEVDKDDHKTVELTKKIPAFGKRRKLAKEEKKMIQSESKTKKTCEFNDNEEEIEEESDSEENKIEPNDRIKDNSTQSINEETNVENTIDEKEKPNVIESIDNNSVEDEEKRRKKNFKRIQQRQTRADYEKKKGYAEDASREDYNMWVPPKGQSGDGKTKLNEKYGY